MHRYIILLVLGIFGCVYMVRIVDMNSIALPAFTLGSVVSQAIETPTLFFAGDIMLGRGVERLHAASGTNPFADVSVFVAESDVSIANFEGSVPELHQPTQNQGFSFSIATSSLTLLKNAGFDVLSLANNHAFDFGSEGYEHTRSRCFAHGLSCYGNPSRLDDSSTAFIQAKHTTIGLLFLHTLYGNPDPFTLSLLIEQLTRDSDIQIAFVHWGEEYEHVHSKSQEALAHTLIDAGIDAVIGHHPHVVQDIERYENGVIFYSLGNFIFDQYFSLDVQQGLGIRVAIEEDFVSYSLIPFSSVESRSTPHVMNNDEKTLFFEQFIKDSPIDFSSTPYPTLTVPRS